MCSSIVFVTIPYNERNKNFINKNFIRNLNNNSILINVSRPGIFCSKDIFEFIKRLILAKVKWTRTILKMIPKIA